MNRIFFPWRWGGSSAQAWMPTYVSILRIPQMIWVWRATVELYWQGKNRRTRRKTCPSATLSTTNPTWIDTDANPGLLGERPATNDLSHGTARREYTLLTSGSWQNSNKSLLRNKQPSVPTDTELLMSHLGNARCGVSFRLWVCVLGSFVCGHMIHFQSNQYSENCMQL
jgi:hypothetical protein